MPAAEAGRVKKHTKPTPPAWIINQVYWRSRSVYQRLIEAGTLLRTTQLDVLAGGTRDRMQRAAEAHRKAVADALHQALRHATAAGLRAQPDSLLRSLEALSLSAAPPDPPGRLTDVIAPAGFEALSGVIVAAAGPAEAAPGPPPSETGGQPHRPDAMDSRHEAARRAAIAQATAHLAATRDAEQAALAQLAHAERSVLTAEAALATSRHDLTTAQAAAQKASRVRQDAEQALTVTTAAPHP